MRRRGYAIHAQDFEEFKAASIEKISNPDTLSSSPYTKSSVQTEDSQSDAFKARKLERELKKADPNLWNDFDFKAKPEDQENSDDLSQASTADGLDSPTARLSGDFSGKSNAIVTNFMVIGSQEVQVPHLLNTIFEEDSLKTSHYNPAFDLIVKDYEMQGQLYKLKFWMQDPTHKKNQEIIQTYYTSNRTYLFVYKQNSRKSFDCLAEAIEKVKAKLAEGSFKGLLVCDNTGIDKGDNQRVLEEEAESLVLKYGLMGKVDTNESLQELKQEISKFLAPKIENKGNLYLFPCI